MSSDSDKVHDEINLMRLQLDALLLGQGRLETAVAGIAEVSWSPASKDSEAVEANARKHTFRCEVAHGAPDIGVASPATGPQVPQQPQDWPTASEPESKEDDEMNEMEKVISDRRASSKEGTETVMQMMTQQASQAQEIQKRRQARFKRIVETNKEVEKAEQDKQREEQMWKSKTFYEQVVHALKDLENYLDMFMGVLILLNTVFIGLSLDHQESGWNAWKVVDTLLSLMFFCEFLFKLYLHRGDFVEHYLGPDKFSNMFDSLIIVLDMSQLIATLAETAGDSTSDSNMAKNVSLLRVFRLVRVLRILRALDLEQTKALVDMLQALLGGLGTLGWSVFLLAFFVYIAALIGRVFFGKESDADITEIYPAFQSVPRSMLTTFRCGFGDCSNDEGTPLAELLAKHHGSGFAIGYCAFTFFITIGFFNIVSAIFVDSTMAASAEQLLRSKQQRLDDGNLFAKCAIDILQKLVVAHNELVEAPNTSSSGDRISVSGEGLSSNLEGLLHLEFDRDLVSEVIKDKSVKDALGLLDVDPNDHGRLSDILDPDHSGSIGVLELVDGLRRLRGEPRRSDVVALDLMMRSLQDKTQTVLEEVLLAHQANDDNEKFLKDHVNTVTSMLADVALALDRSRTVGAI